MPLLRFRLPWRSFALTAATALLALAQTALAPLASAEPVPEPEDDRGCSESGDPLRYVIVFDEGTTAKRAKSEVKQACGKLTMYYDAIAVGVATTRDDEFGKRLGLDRAFSAQAHRSGFAPQLERLEPTRPGGLDSADRTAEQWDMRMIDAAAARRHAPKHSDVLVGVLDSGIDAAHPDLAEAVDPKASASCLSGKPNTTKRAWAPTTSVHGTHVAGTIAAADDGVGVVGVAPGVRLASIKVIGDEGQVDPEAAVCGLMWAGKHRMPVTNSSFFVDSGSTSCSSEDEYGVVREAVRRAADYASRVGTLNVAAATNESVSLSPAAGTEAKGCEALPASLRSVIAVSSVDSDGLKSGYSSYGLGVISLAAPGGDGDECVLSTVPDGYADTCGTSMAAPHVAGVAALLAARNPDAGPEQLRRSLTSTAQQTACPADYDRAGDGHQDAFCTGYRGYNGFYGHGVLDALAAVQSIADRAEPDRKAKPKKSKPPRREQSDAKPADPAPELLSQPDDDQRPHPGLGLQLGLGSLLGAR